MTAHQQHILWKLTEAKLYLKNEESYQLAQLLNISEPRIKCWFSKKRYAKRRKGLLHEGEWYSVKYTKCGSRYVQAYTSGENDHFMRHHGKETCGHALNKCAYPM